MRGTRTRTARTTRDVEEWIESEPHHRAYLEPTDVPIDQATHINLCGHGTRLRIPLMLWRRCPTRQGDRFDTRMYRWIHAWEWHDNQQFKSFEDWVMYASRWLTDHPQYRNTEHGDDRGWRGHHFTPICFDTLGRLCRQGADFMRARDEGTFPVRWIWPDQVPELFFQVDRSDPGEFDAAKPS